MTQISYFSGDAGSAAPVRSAAAVVRSSVVTPLRKAAPGRPIARKPVAAAAAPKAKASGDDSVWQEF
jgi:hypothetical protein